MLKWWKLPNYSEMGMVTPSRPIYYLNLFDQLCQPCDSLKRSGIAVTWWNCVPRNVSQQYEEEVVMEKVCWQRHIWEKWQSCTLLGDSCPTTTLQLIQSHFPLFSFFNSCPRRSWCFLFISWLKLNTFLFVCFFNNLIKKYLSVNGTGY